MKSLTSGRLLGRNAIWNLGGSLAPLLAAAIAVPLIISSIGTERFGLLTIVWALAGYFNFFDFGLGQAITHRISHGLEREDDATLAGAVWTALWLMLLIGILAGGLFANSVTWLVEDLLKIPQVLQAEMRTVFYIVAFSLPFVVTTAGFRGVLEAHQAFPQINLIRVPMGIFIFLSPLPVLLFDQSLVPIVVILIAGRLLAWVAYVYFTLKKMPSLQKVLFLQLQQIPPLLSFGGWMTVSNLTLPIMVYFDRFVIGALLSLSAVAFYVTPHEIVTRLRIIPTAMGSVMFPALARSINTKTNDIARLLRESQTAIFLSVLPASLIMTAFAHDAMRLWLNADFADQSAQVVQWLAAGVFINAMGFIPVNMIRAAGRPDIPAKIYLIELPLFFVLLIFAVKTYGINGAAFTYFFRWLIDTIAMLFMCGKLEPRSRADCYRVSWFCGLGLLLLLLLAMLTTTWAKSVVLLLIIASLLVYFRETLVQWRSLLMRKA